MHMLYMLVCLTTLSWIIMFCVFDSNSGMFRPNAFIYQAHFLNKSNLQNEKLLKYSLVTYSRVPYCAYAISCCSSLPRDAASFFYRGLFAS